MASLVIPAIAAAAVALVPVGRPPSRGATVQPTPLPLESTIFSSEIAWSSGHSDLTTCLALGDVDGDGHLDLVCGNYTNGNRLYLNQGRGLSTSPALLVQSGNRIRSLALGDVDSDGDLDLVCGDLEDGCILHLNEGGTFSLEAAWTSEPHYTASIALGDVDGDGDLDLVCGNVGEPGKLFLNQDGVFSATPAWSAGVAHPTEGIALGDVDGDGDLDLVCANYHQSNTLFLNVGGIFTVDPVWSSASKRATTSLALGDVNGDGDLDLVCGNVFQPNTLYLNSGGGFPVEPSWSSGLTCSTRAVALGDVDADGDLDLVCGNDPHGNTLYLNIGGELSTVPVWQSPPGSETHDVALGDVDGDGDLDLIVANGGYPGQSNTMSPNETPHIHTSPAWTSAPPRPTYCVALCDIDRDGDLDLACAKGTHSNSLYFNTGGGFPPSPGWSSEAAQSTRSIAVGDVDGNGKPDLVCGNYGEGNTLHLNETEGLARRPSWRSGAVNPTTCAAIGDVDGDGKPDLVCGNDGASNTLYTNAGRVFATNPVWQSDPANHTESVALGDIDGDGDLDLVCGNSGEQNTMYRNEGGILPASPVWSSGPANHTRCIDLGDVDGDGDLDLVCGNYGQSNALYLNQGGTFETNPAWLSLPVSQTYCVALGDMDGDGDLDLACGNYGQSNTLYLNQGGTFSQNPSWSSNLVATTMGIALGDVDGDGDLDVVCGNGTGNTLFRGAMNPAFLRSLVEPTDQLPNNSAFVCSVKVAQKDTNLYEVSLGAFDVESDPIWIVPEYQFEGVATWFPAEINGCSGKIGPFATSPAGTKYVLDWDVSPLPTDVRSVTLCLRAVATPRQVSLIRRNPSCNVVVGTILPLRPQIASSMASVSFPTLTVGDTACAEIRISNEGNIPLAVTGIDLPSDEMRCDLALPCRIDPGEGTDMTVFLEPRNETSISGNISIISNDPVRPISYVGIETDVRALEIVSRLLTAEPKVPLGVALTVIITPAPDVRVEKGFLSYRPCDTGAFLDTVPLTRLAGDFIAVIPAEGVTEAGLEYYIKVENSGVFGTDPPRAPEESTYCQAVASPEAIAVTPHPNSGPDFLEGRGITVLVSLPNGTGFIDGALHLRRGGENQYTVLDLEKAEPQPRVVIPDTLVGPRGLEYWASVNTLTTSLTYPAEDPTSSPARIRVTVADLAEEETSPGNEYRMVTVPLDFGMDFAGTIETLLSDQPEFGPYNPNKWRSFRYMPSLADYVENSDQYREAFEPVPGRGFWLICSRSNKISTAPVKGASVPTDSMCRVILEPGWNQIGNPFVFPVAWNSVVVDSLAMPEAEGLLIEPAVRYQIGDGYMHDVEILEPFEGYWVKNLSAGGVALSIPPQEAREPGSLLASRDEAWRIEIRAAAEGAVDFANHVGVRRDASVGWDRYDRSEPPMAPGRALSLYFPHTAWEGHPGNYTSDIRGLYETAGAAWLGIGQVGAGQQGESGWGRMWRFDVAKSFADKGVADEVLLTISGLEALPEEVEAYLIDRHLEIFADLRVAGSYRFHLGVRGPVTEEDARFALIVGSPEFVETTKDELLTPPIRTALHQNYPNPFTTSTIIRYDLARAGCLSLRIYDAGGALVKVIDDGPRDPGRYEAIWFGENQSGRRVAPGIYFCHFRTGGGVTATGKIIVLR